MVVEEPRTANGWNGTEPMEGHPLIPNAPTAPGRRLRDVGSAVAPFPDAAAGSVLG